VHVPGNPDQYYLFTSPEINAFNGFRYSIIDMSLNSGLGDVTSVKNVLLLDSATEQCTVIPAGNNALWMITRKFEPKWYVFKIDSSGIYPPVVSSAGPVYYPFLGNGVGYMKASPLHNKIAIANYGYMPGDSYFDVYDFDSTTGEVSSVFQLSINSPVYACEFSPDGTRLYAAQWVVMFINLTSLPALLLT
jgi:hypothetical protein